VEVIKVFIFKFIYLYLLFPPFHIFFFSKHFAPCVSLFPRFPWLCSTNTRTKIVANKNDAFVGCLTDYCNWNPPDYVDHCTPTSPSISLTHAYRDGELVNVPCNLLVHGDVIVLGPSQSAPACIELINVSMSLYVCIAQFHMTSHFKCQSKNMTIALHECQKWKEQVKVCYHRKWSSVNFWISKIREN
jgi:hypothetical protein